MTGGGGGGLSTPWFGRSSPAGTTGTLKFCEFFTSAISTDVGNSSYRRIGVLRNCNCNR